MLLLVATSTGQPMPELLAQMLMVIGVVAIGVLLTVSIRSKIARKQAATPPPSQRIAQVKSVRSLTEDRHAVSADLQDTARRLSALLDDKAERLEQLIEEAELRIHELQHLTDGASRNGQSLASRATAEAEHVTRELQAELSEPELAPVASIPEPVGVDPLTRSVYELADAGHDSVSIAQVLDEQIGKVELILALREE